jgi:hypothetical protein
MPAVMDYIRRYEFGLDLGNVGPGAPNFGLVMEGDLIRLHYLVD